MEPNPTPAQPVTPAPAPNDPPAPAADPGAADPWAAFGLDDELKSFVGTKTPADIAKELKGAQALIGKKTIGVPGKDSTPEEQRAFHAARGVPETAEGYDFTATLDELMQNAPEGYKRDEAREAKFRTWARQSNLSNSEANAFIKQFFADEFTSNADTIRQQSEATTKAKGLIAEKWGPQAEAKTNAANRFARHIGLDQETIDVFLAVAGSKPEARFNLVNFFADQGAMLEEGGDGSAPIQPGAGAMSADQARIAKDQFLAQGDNMAAYMDSSHPRHAAVEKQVTIYAKIERGIK